MSTLSLSRTALVQVGSDSILGRQIPDLAALIATYQNGSMAQPVLQEDGFTVRLFNESAVQVDALPSCQNFFWLGSIIKGDPNVAGIGIISVFAVSAWSIWTLALAAYARGHLSPLVIRPIDRDLLRANSRRCENRLAAAVARGALAISDLQMCLGIAVVFTAFLQLDRISIYHYRLAIGLGWLSGNVQLTAMLMLQDVLRRNRHLLWPRLFGTTVFFALLLVSLIPTATATFNHYINTSPESIDTADIPAKCFWQAVVKPGTSGHLAGIPWADNAAQVIAIIVLFISFAWRTLSLFPSSRRRLLYALRFHPRYVLENSLVWLDWRPGCGGLVRSVLFKAVTSAFVLHHTAFEILESFSGALCLITMSLIWGTLSLIQSRVEDQRSEAITKIEGKWTLLQSVAVALLVLPIAAAAETYHNHARDPTASIIDASGYANPAFAPGETEYQPGTDQAKSETVVTTSMTACAPPSEHSADTVPDKPPSPLTFSAALRLYSSAAYPSDPSTSPAFPPPPLASKPSLLSTLLHRQTRQTAHETHHDPQPPQAPHVAFLHSTRFFIVLVWLVYVLLLATVVWQCLSAFVFAQGAVWWMGLAWAAGCAGAMASLVLVGGWGFSRAFR